MDELDQAKVEESIQSKLRAVIEDEVEKDANDSEVLNEANNMYDIGKNNSLIILYLM